MMWRFWLALSVLAMSIVTAGITGWSGHWMSGLATFVAGAGLSAQIAFGFIRTFESTGVRSAYAIAMLFGFAAIFMEHRIFEPGRSEVQAAGLQAFIQLDVSQCPGRPANFTEFQNSGTSACALQNTLDQMDVIQQFQKAEKLPGELALGDSIYQLSKESSSDRCIDLMRILAKACPYALSNKAAEQLSALQRK
jgi:hypothetical protein